MKVKCFECDAQLDADTAHEAVEAFLTHAGESHTWTYPDAAIRNYARNYAEATERLTGGTERLVAIGDVTVHPATAERIDDWLQFFDHDAFADNPGWASCYCLEPHEPAASERSWRDTRASMTDRLRCCSTVGYLAYVDGRAAGWVNASPRSEYGLYKQVDVGGPPPQSVIGISCFVVAPPFRRHGVAAALLDRAILDAAARGASWIEGYPHNKPDGGDAAHFRGSRSMFEERGFQPVEVHDRYTVMRRAVT